MSIWKWIDGDNGRFRAWTFGMLCGGFMGLIIGMSVLIFVEKP